MITMFVTYAGDATTPFDRDHWIHVHLPLVRASWAPHGLIAVAGFFPASAEAGLIAVATVTFRDAQALDAALAAPETERVMADVDRVTAVAPRRWIATPL